MAKKRKTYHLIIESTGDLGGEGVEKYNVKAIDIYEAIVGLTEQQEEVEENWKGDAKEFIKATGEIKFSPTLPKAGNYFDEENTIGFGGTYEEACVQFVELRLSQGC